MTSFTPKGVLPILPYLRPRPKSGPWLAFGEGARTVLVHHGVLVAVRAWASLGEPNERLGLLAGRGCEDSSGPYTLVMGAVPTAGAVGSRAHVAGDVQAMWRTRETLLACYPVAEVVGWWHTHPGYGTHFSGTDRETQATYRAEHLVGLVVDPRIPGERGFGLYVGPRCTRLEVRPGLPLVGAAADCRLLGAS